jgi:hypothetical protein
MEATISMGIASQAVKEKLVSIEEPKNAILARLQSCFTDEKSNHIASGYSRMHNRHNRS